MESFEAPLAVFRQLADALYAGAIDIDEAISRINEQAAEVLENYQHARVGATATGAARAYIELWLGAEAALILQDAGTRVFLLLRDGDDESFHIAGRLFGIVLPPLMQDYLDAVDRGDMAAAVDAVDAALEAHSVWHEVGLERRLSGSIRY